MICTVLELALLGLLKERPMHGYDLRKRLREDFGALSHLSFGSLYPALARLEASGSVRAVALTQERSEQVLHLTGSLGGERAAAIARRATAKAALALGGHGTRARKVYEISEKGEALFEQLLAVPDVADGDARSFSLRLAFARHLSPAARIRLLEQRRSELADLLARVERSYALREHELDAYGRSLAEHSRECTAAEMSWIERLLEREHGSAKDSRPRTPAVSRRAANASPAVPENKSPLSRPVTTGGGLHGRTTS